jgi:hypothetical protein
MADIINKVRFYHFISGVLGQQQADPYCSKCKAFASTAAAMKEGLAGLENISAQMAPEEALGLIEKARERIRMVSLPADAIGQKKAGNCKMPEGVCFVKLSKAILASL